MKSRELLRNEVIAKSVELALEYSESEDLEVDRKLYIDEYVDQFKDGSYLLYLRSWLGYMIECGNKQAVDIMKDLIRYKLSA